MKQKIVTIYGKPVIDIYESVDGSYWFITEKCYKQDSLVNGTVYHDDQILFGFVRLAARPQFAEWGYISETELKLLGARVCKVPPINWPVCPLVEVKEIVEDEEDEQKGESNLLSFIYAYTQATERRFS